MLRTNSSPLASRCTFQAGKTGIRTLQRIHHVFDGTWILNRVTVLQQPLLGDVEMLHNMLAR